MGLVFLAEDTFLFEDLLPLLLERRSDR